jgi:hypothetical protein
MVMTIEEAKQVAQLLNDVERKQSIVTNYMTKQVTNKMRGQSDPLLTKMIEDARIELGLAKLKLELYEK